MHFLFISGLTLSTNQGHFNFTGGQKLVREFFVFGLPAVIRFKNMIIYSKKKKKEINLQGYFDDGDRG